MKIISVIFLLSTLNSSSLIPHGTESYTCITSKRSALPCSIPNFDFPHSHSCLSLVFKKKIQNLLSDTSLANPNYPRLAPQWLPQLSWTSRDMIMSQLYIIGYILMSHAIYTGAGVRFVNHEYDYRPTSDDTKSTYQLIIKITIFEKHKK